MNIYMSDNLCSIYKLQFHKIQNCLVENGHSIVFDLEKADAVIVGACAAFEADENRSVKLIERAKEKCEKIYVYGCLSEVNPKKINSENKYKTWDAKQLCETICDGGEINWDNIELPVEFRCKEDYRVYNTKKKFIGLTTGCCFECVYCPHKLGAGELKSRNEKDILSQIIQLNKEDIDTIVLMGIDTASYGLDKNTNFSQLLNKILKLYRADRDLHIAQFNPEGLSYDYELLVDLCKDSRVKDMQLPIQTTSSRLLSIMKRNYSKELVHKFITSVRKDNIGIRFRTDLMVGFPTETLKELDDSIDFAIEHFDEIAVYGFEFKSKTEIENLNLEYFDLKEVERRRLYALQRIKESNILVHSGGQFIDTLLEADAKKEELRGEINDK